MDGLRPWITEGMSNEVKRVPSLRVEIFVHVYL